MAFAAEELAGDLRAALGPGEPVHWRSEIATARVRNLATRAAIGLGSLLCLAGVWLMPGKTGPAALLLSLVLFGVAITAGVSVMNKLCHSAVVLCPDRLVWRQGIPFRSPVRSVPRGDLTLAVVYEGENTVILNGESGELARITNIASPRDMALMLHVPVHVWIDRKVTSHGNLLARGAVGLGAMIVGTNVSQLPSNLITGTFRLRAALVTAVILAIAGALYLGGHWWRARSMSAEQRRETACYILDPLWRGRDPYTRGHIPWSDFPFVAARMWLVRNVYSGPYDCRCDIGPLVYQPNSMVPD